VKRQSKERKKNFTSYFSDEGLIPMIHKELKKLNNTINKGAIELNR
jgi:hypothetical protein